MYDTIILILMSISDYDNLKHKTLLTKQVIRLFCHVIYGMDIIIIYQEQPQRKQLNN